MSLLINCVFPQIFRYDHPTADIIHEDFTGRLQWQGTLARDIQIGAIYLHNITFNDTGTYRCTFHRTFFFSQYEQAVVVQKEVELSVVTEGKAQYCSTNCIFFFFFKGTAASFACVFSIVRKSSA